MGVIPNMDMYQLQELLKKKWFIMIASGILISVLLVFLVLQAITKEEANSPQDLVTQPDTPQTQQTENVQNQDYQIPANSPEMQKAIEEAKQSAQEYDNWQANLRTDYPWLRKLPLATPKYFVYFDLDKGLFIGRLYPKRGDNVEQMKVDIQRQLKDVKQIPVENYTFEWIVIAQ